MEIDNQEMLPENPGNGEKKLERRHTQHRSVLLSPSREAASYRHCAVLDDVRAFAPRAGAGAWLPVRTHLSSDQLR